MLAGGSLAVSASRDHTLRLWDLLSGQERFTLQDGGSQDAGEAQAFSLHVDEPRQVLYSVSSCMVGPGHWQGKEGPGQGRDWPSERHMGI